MNNPVIWFEIYVQDMPRAKAFYESVFKLKLERLENTDMEMWAFPMEMERVGAGGALAKMDGVASGRNSTLVYFSCEDCSIEAAQVTSHGGSVSREKTSIGQYGFMALVVDTEGNMIGLHSLK
ncbi:MAG: VOC family protein [Chlorobium sp.]|nr:MAG: VOC family protein [Chlorobium sp.]